MKIVVIAHVYYSDVWPEIASHLHKWRGRFDLFVTTTEDRIEQVRRIVSRDFPAAAVFGYPNRGRDIAPFLCCFLNVIGDHQIICKVHTKKTIGFGHGDSWRHDLYSKTVGLDPRTVLAAFEQEPTLGILAPHEHLVPHRMGWKSNGENVMKLAAMMGRTENLLPFRFPAGSMFWARASALQRLARLNLSSEDFQEEAGQTDGTLAHALERLFPLAARLSGYETTDTRSLPSLIRPHHAENMVPWWTSAYPAQTQEKRGFLRRVAVHLGVAAA